ncbi:MAG TPA: NUDIX domain-containing protein, partial [Stellaceae bacterium]|nr:NUDIX domain-containing protein [Stellaceae bacterium]
QELGETVVECAQRELTEETSILADPLEVLTVLDVIRWDEAGRVRIHFALVCVLAAWRSGEGEAGEDALALGWFTPEEVIARGLDTSASAVEVMRLALARA